MTPTPPPLHRTSWRAFWLWSVALIALKLLFVAAIADIFFYGEELAKGSVAKGMLDRIPVEFHTLSYHYYEGGGFFISGLKALFFALVGENMLAHRLLGITTCWAVFWAYWRLVSYHFGPRAAHWAAAIFLLGPMGFQRYNTLSLGIHFEAMVFGMLLFDEGLRLVRHRDWQPSWVRATLVGIVAGFGVFFSYQNALVLGWVGLWVLILRWRWVFSKGGLALAAGCALGISPLAYMYAHVGDALRDVHGTDFSAVNSTWDRFVAFLEWTYTGRTWNDLFAHIRYPIIVAVTVLAAVIWSRGRRWILAYFLGFVALWLAAWYAGPFMEPKPVTFFAWLRWAPITLVLMIVGAQGVALASDRMRGSRVLVVGAALLALATGLFESLGILRGGRLAEAGTNWALLRETKGYNYRGHFGSLMAHQPDLSHESLRPLLAYNETPRDLLLGDFAACLTSIDPKTRTWEEWIEWFEALEPGSSKLFARGMGPALVRPFGGALTPALDAVQKAPANVRDSLQEAIGYAGTGWSFRPHDILNDYKTVRSDLRTDAFARGVGARLFRYCVVYPYGEHLVMDPKAAFRFIDEFPADAQERIRAGFEQERALWRLEPRTNP